MCEANPNDTTGCIGGTMRSARFPMGWPHCCDAFGHPDTRGPATTLGDLVYGSDRYDPHSVFRPGGSEATEDER